MQWNSPRIGAVRGDLVSQPVGEIDHQLAYSPEGIHQNLLRMLSHVIER